jgi:hypothetical protein
VVQVSLRLHPPLRDSTSSLTNRPSTYEISTAYFHASYTPSNFPALSERNAPIFDLPLHPGILVDLSGSSARCRKTRTQASLIASILLSSYNQMHTHCLGELVIQQFFPPTQSGASELS